MSGECLPPRYPQCSLELARDVSRTVRVLLTLSALFAAPPGAEAQSFIGVTGAKGSATIEGDALRRGEVLGRGTLGFRAVGGLDVGDGVYLVVMPGWVTRGASIRVAQPPPERGVIRSELAIDYVSVPVGLRVRARNEHIYVTSVVDFGRVVSATLSTVTPTPFGVPDQSPESEQDVLENLKAWDVSVGLSAGALIPVGGPSVSIEVAWGQSLLNATRSDFLPVDWSLPPRFKFAGFSLLLGIQYELGSGGDS